MSVNHVNTQSVPILFHVQCGPRCSQDVSEVGYRAMYLEKAGGLRAPLLMPRAEGTPEGTSSCTMSQGDPMGPGWYTLCSARWHSCPWCPLKICPAHLSCLFAQDSQKFMKITIMMRNKNHEKNDNLWAPLAGLLGTSWNLFSLSQFGDILVLNVALC